MTAGGDAPDSVFYRRLAAHAGLPYADLGEGGDALAPDALPESLCRELGVVAVRRAGELAIALADPFDATAVGRVRAAAGHGLPVAVAAPGEIASAIERAYSPPAPSAAPAPAPPAPAPPAPEPALTPAPTPAPRPEPAAPAPAPPAASATPDAQAARRPGRRFARGEPERRRLGELLVDLELVAPRDVEAALAEQRRTGDRVGEILVHAGRVGPAALEGALADQLGVPAVDVRELDPDPQALELVPEGLARQRRILPLAVEGDRLTVAAPEPPGERPIAELRAATGLEPRAWLAPARDIDAALRRAHAGVHVEAARGELGQRFPEESAERLLTPGLVVAGLLAVLALAAGLALAPAATASGVVIACAAGCALVALHPLLLARAVAGWHPEIAVPAKDLAALAERDLPRYTVLVPLRAAVEAPPVLTHLAALDYPATKLAVRLLVEEDDLTTRSTLEQLDLLPRFEVVAVPAAEPRTRAKALNYGLLQADGELVAVFGPRDRPEADQLKRAALAFRHASPELVALQCKIGAFNQERSLVTRLAAAECAAWFDLQLPGLAAAGAPVPLSGSSCHLRLVALAEAAGWDAFKEAAGVDLGIRLAKGGRRSAVLESGTLADASPGLAAWLELQARRAHGHLQATIVQLRRPIALVRAIGLRPALALGSTVGAVLAELALPLLWVAALTGAAAAAGAFAAPLAPAAHWAAAGALLIGATSFAAVTIAGARRRGSVRLARAALVSPLAWLMRPPAAWLGLGRLVRPRRRSRA